VPPAQGLENASIIFPR